MVLALKTVWDRSAAKNRALLDIFLLLVTSLKKPLIIGLLILSKDAVIFLNCFAEGVAQDFGRVSQMRFYLS